MQYPQKAWTVAVRGMAAMPASAKEEAETSTGTTIISSLTGPATTNARAASRALEVATALRPHHIHHKLDFLRSLALRAHPVSVRIRDHPNPTFVVMLCRIPARLGKA
jgi:hypothetical protein